LISRRSRVVTDDLARLIDADGGSVRGLRDVNRLEAAILHHESVAMLGVCVKVVSHHNAATVNAENLCV
jgi:hypothetical protein